MEAEVAELQQRVAAAKDAFEAAAAKLAEKRARLAECDRELAALAAEKSELQTKLADGAAERKRLAHRHAPRSHGHMAIFWFRVMPERVFLNTFRHKP